MTVAAPKIAENSGFDFVGYHDLDGRPGFKLALHEAQGRWFLYTGHLWYRGWSVVDITDPTEPRMLRTIDGPSGTWTIQVQAADGLLVTGLEKPGPGWGVDPGTPFEEGVLLWDISTDPAQPRLVGTWHSGGTGTHRNFYAGGNYAFLAASKPGHVGNMLRILDVSVPAQPREVGSWCLPEQCLNVGQEVVQRAYLHGPAYAVGNRAYLSYGRRGLVILDITDVRRPALVSRLDFGDLGGAVGCHSAIPIPSRGLLAANSEAILEGSGDPLNYAFVVDISVESSPRVLSSLPVPVPSPGLPYSTYYAKGGRFGPHNQHQYQENRAHAELRQHVLLTYFNAGLRLFDISEPRQPHEIGCFVPKDPSQRRGPLPTALVTQFEDVIVDARGYIYCTDKNYGLFILRSHVPLR